MTGVTEVAGGVVIAGAAVIVVFTIAAGGAGVGTLADDVEL